MSKVQGVATAAGRQLVASCDLAIALDEAWICDAVAASSEYTVSLGKRAFYEQIDMPQEEAYRFARSVMERNALAEVAQAQMRGFLEKRGVR